MQATWDQQKKNMLKNQIITRGINNKELLTAMEQVPRHFFLNQPQIQYAYEDCALPIDCDQTISQPYIVALMTNTLLSCNRDKVLEIGTGCGYQSAIFSKLFKNVFTIERISYLQQKAKIKLQKISVNNIFFYHRDGWLGLAEKAPFDAILVACAVQKIPPKLCEQLALGGKMIIPIGNKISQELVLVQRISQIEYKETLISKVVFVPMKKSTQLR